MSIAAGVVFRLVESSMWLLDGNREQHFNAQQSLRALGQIDYNMGCFNILAIIIWVKNTFV